ncbi:MAG: dihydroorotate dehydrogenase electron transfer subunit, partial [Gammaproteobacteria bacterium]
MNHPDTRNTISLENAKVLSQQAYPGDQYILRLHAPQIAADSRPGSFVHMSCDETLLMRRPMSIMRADPQAGWIDILYKAHGLGTRLLARQAVGNSLSVLGPIGVPFRLSDYRKRPLLIGGGVGIPPMVNLAEHIRD